MPLCYGLLYTFTLAEQVERKTCPGVLEWHGTNLMTTIEQSNTENGDGGDKKSVLKTYNLEIRVYARCYLLTGQLWCGVNMTVANDYPMHRHHASF